MRRARFNSALSGRWTGSLILAMLWIACLSSPAASEDSSAAFKRYEAAKADYESQPQNPEAAWQFGRACFDMREASTNKAQRAVISQEGIAACRRALMSTNSAPLRYYLALNLGALAEIRGLSALKLVSQMEQELLATIALDPRIDHAGPERTLGLLYRDAPAIISVGNRSKARQHLLRAVKLAPRYPENRLELIQAFLKWNDRTDARKELKALEDSWSAIRAEFVGPEWESALRDWEVQLEKLKKELEEPAKLRTPRD